MKHKKVAILGAETLEGEVFKNFTEDHPLNEIDLVFFQGKETVFSSYKNSATFILEEKLEYLLDFPLIVDLKKDREKKLDLESYILHSSRTEKDSLIFYGLNHEKLKVEKRFKLPSPLSSFLLRILSNFKNMKPEKIFCNIVLPTSDEGREGQDELYNQTIALLNLSDFKNKIYKNQIAFNISIFPDKKLREEIQKEIESLIGQKIPIYFQLSKGGIFFGTLIFLNAIFSSAEEKIKFEEYLTGLEGFEIESKYRGVAEAVREGKVFLKINSEKNLEVSNLLILGDPLYSGFSYNIHNLIEEFFMVK